MSGTTGNYESLENSSVRIPDDEPPLKRIKTEGHITSSPPMDRIQLEQTGPVLAGPGAMRTPTEFLLSGLVKLTAEQQEMVRKAKKYAMEQTIKNVLMKQTISHQQQQQKTLQRHQALVLMCRVYVGSISFELKEDTIRQAFAPFGPIKSINMSRDPVSQKHKGFAFVEYEVPEAAQLALDQMNGALIGGREIKVGRPSNMPQAAAIIQDIMEEAKKYSRIYVASVHQDLSDQDIQSLFEVFGPIKTCKLENGGTSRKHKGYAFIEYENQQAARDAVSSMNLFDLGGQYLRVGRIVVPPDAFQGPSTAGSMPTAAAVAAAAATAKIQAMDAVASNELALGLGTSSVTASPPISALSPGITVPAAGAPDLIFPGITRRLVLSPNVPGVVTGVTSVVTPPPGIITLPVSTTVPAVMREVASADRTVATTGVETVCAGQKPKAVEMQLAEAQEPQTLEQHENMVIKGKNARHILMQKLMRSGSSVVILRNMIDVEDLDDEFESEVKDECVRFGTVNKVLIYQERQSDEEDAAVVVKIIVEFSDPQEAVKARDALNGRFFGGRQITAELYNQMSYEANDFSG